MIAPFETNRFLEHLEPVAGNPETDRVPVRVLISEWQSYGLWPMVNHRSTIPSTEVTRRQICNALLIATLLSSSAFTQNDVQASDRAYIRQSESDWAGSVASQDCGVMERILADDFVGVGVDGVHYTKAQAVNQCKTHDSNFEFNHLRKVDIRFYGDMATAQGSEGWKLKTGKPGEFIWTDTLLKRNGTWQIVAAEDLMPVPDPFCECAFAQEIVAQKLITTPAPDSRPGNQFPLRAVLK